MQNANHLTMDFTETCRICLKKHKHAYDIFTDIYEKWKISFSEMLITCTKLKPYQDDGLPRKICKVCSRQLKKTYSFNLLCEESDRKLNEYLSNKQSIKVTIYNSIYDEKENTIKIETVVETENTETAEHTNPGPSEFDIIKISEKDIKQEPTDLKDEDIYWDAEDNDVLQDIKLQKDREELFHLEEIPKKRRGRKKRVQEGEEPVLPESKLPHQCDICGKFLSTKSNLKAHKICHTELRPYKCTTCPATFRGHSALFQHKKVHTGETPYHCEYCPKQFSRRTGLVNHIRMHTGEKLFSCDICFKNFVQSAQLSIHMKRHKGDKTFLCQECGKGFPIKSDLKVHQRVHNGEKPYSCHLCTKTFTTSGNLNIHVRIHNKEVRYKCKECLRGFVTCSAYKVHLKRHKGQRDYQCECGKTFYTSSALKQHRVVHTGEKKYQCKICDRKFSQTSHLSRHFKRDHAKPNMPVPSSDHYKVVLQDSGGRKDIFGIIDVQHVTMRNDVKCEGS